MVGVQHLKPVVVLKNRESQLSCILAQLFNMSEGTLFFGLLQGLIRGPCIYECWGKVYSS